MDYNKIDIPDIEISEEPFTINKDVSFYAIKYDEDKLKFQVPKLKSYTGIKTNTFNKDEINLAVNDDFKEFLRKLENDIQDRVKNIFITETKDFSSLLKQYKDYPEYIKPSIDKYTRYKPSIDYKNHDVNVVITITGVWVNTKSYGLSMKLNKINID